MLRGRKLKRLIPWRGEVRLLEKEGRVKDSLSQF